MNYIWENMCFYLRKHVKPPCDKTCAEHGYGCYVFHVRAWKNISICCIVVISHPDDGHMADGNMLVKSNNMWWNIFRNAHLFDCHIGKKFSYEHLTLILLRWRIWWAPNNTSKRQMSFNSAFKGLMLLHTNVTSFIVRWAILPKLKVTFPCVQNIYLSSCAVWTLLKCVYPNYMRTGRSIKGTSVIPVTVQVTSASLNIPFIWSAGAPHKFLCRFIFIYT